MKVFEEEAVSLDINELIKWVAALPPEKLFEMSQDDRFTGSEKRFLYDTGRKISRKESLSTKQMQWLNSIFTKADSAETSSAYESSQEYVSRPHNSHEHRHLCVRLAWHDNGWDGNICKEPENNIYCVGEQSLLSDRLRRLRDLKVECSKDCKGKSANNKALGDYQPPCFWSINAFGNQQLEFSHDNPAEKTYPHIKESMPPYSVISWPFDLAFVRDPAEQKKLGSYYPKEIFERRIKDFHGKVVEDKSIAFLYCKFSNPVSGDDSDFLLVGCALVSSKGSLNWFNVSKETLQATKDKKKEPNFPTLNWALRYSMDYENTGIRIPYQEYLKLIDVPGGLPQSYLDDIKIVIREPELVDGFTYVAKHVDDDQAIFLLMKLRQSILEIKRHALLKGFDSDKQLSKIDSLLAHAWRSRSYFPGLKPLILATLNRNSSDSKDVDEFISTLALTSVDTFATLKSLISESAAISNHKDLIGDLIDNIESYALDADQFIRLSTLNLTTLQFRRILKQDGLEHSPDQVANNPYLLFESYEPQEQDTDKTSGEKIDALVDLFKIDIALYPHRKYQERNPTFHNWKLNDKRRIRAVLVLLLRELESMGHCYDTASNLAKQIEKYPLFYQIGDDYRTNINLNALETGYRVHFEESVIVGKLDGQTIYYLKEVYDDEQFVINTIEKLMAASDNNVKVEEALVEQAKSASTELKRKIGDRFPVQEFIAERERLYSVLPFRKFSVLTGSPGAGKSFELLKLVEFLGKSQERYLILSLTGKAVLRLKNNELGIKNVQAKTIDKFLTEIERQKGVKSIVNNLIIEEASMADLHKLAELLRAVDPLGSHFRRLILVGDENQLPPIGYGKPFADILDSLKSDSKIADRHFVSLTTNCRAELPEDFIGFTKIFSNENKMAEQVLANVVEKCGTSGVSLYTWASKEKLYDQIKEEFSKLTSNPKDLSDGLDQVLGLTPGYKEKPDGIDNFQVMSPYRMGHSGVSGLNLLFQSEFRKSDQFTQKLGEMSFRVGDKLIHTKNEYIDNELYVSNGSFGIAAGYNSIFFAEKDSASRFSDLRSPENLELAYAITVHKSQGSGFRHVFIVIPKRKGLLSRELMFTALTRTKEKVTVFVESSDQKETKKLLNQICSNSSIAGIRTTLAIGPSKEFAYIPEEGVEVKSRVEYIIYRKLSEAKAKIGGFEFKYENTYELQNGSFDFHPDFTIWLEDNKTIYWEHLGRVHDKSYIKMWDERRKIYESKGDFEKVLTTDEVNGISDEKIEAIIKGLLENNLKTEDSANRYSRMHFSLR